MFGNDLNVGVARDPTTVSYYKHNHNYSHVSCDQLNIYRTYSLDVFNNSQLNMVR